MPDIFGKNTKDLVYKTILEALDNNVKSVSGVAVTGDPELVAGKYLAEKYKVTDFYTLYRIVQNIKYIPDEERYNLLGKQASGEVSQSAVLTAYAMSGDCDDIARLLYFAARSLPFNYEVYELVVTWNENGKYYGHAFIGIHDVKNKIIAILNYTRYLIYTYESFSYKIFFDLWKTFLHYDGRDAELEVGALVKYRDWTGSYDRRMEIVEGGYFYKDGKFDVYSLEDIEAVGYTWSQKFPKWIVFAVIIVLLIGGLISW